MQGRFIKLFCILSIFAVVQMGLFYSIGGLGNLKTDVGLYARTSFGNMGFAKTVCMKQIINYDGEPRADIHVQCEKTTRITDVVFSGVMLSKSLPMGTDDITTICDTEHFVQDSWSEKANSHYFD